MREHLRMHLCAQQHMSLPPEHFSTSLRGLPTFEQVRPSALANRPPMASAYIMLACMVCRICGASMLPSLCGSSSWVDVCMARSGRVKVTVSRLGWPAWHRLVRWCVARLQLRPEWPWVSHTSPPSQHSCTRSQPCTSLLWSPSTA